MTSPAATPIRSVVYWTNPAWKVKLQELAKQHSMDVSPFLETLILAWFDPLHFSRMLRWLYPEGHPAFDLASGADRTHELEERLARLTHAANEALGDRAVAERRIRALEEEAGRTQNRERLLRERVEALQGILREGIISAIQRGEPFYAEAPLAALQVVDRIQCERSGTESSQAMGVPESLIIDALRKEGYSRAIASAELEGAVLSGLLDRTGVLYQLPPRSREL